GELLGARVHAALRPPEAIEDLMEDGNVFLLVDQRRLGGLAEESRVVQANVAGRVDEGHHLPGRDHDAVRAQGAAKPQRPVDETLTEIDARALWGLSCHSLPPPPSYRDCSAAPRGRPPGASESRPACWKPSPC